MEFEELSRKLFELSESERAYRDGKSYAWDDSGSWVMVDDRKMLRMGDSMLVGDARSWCIPSDSTRALPLSGAFAIRRNSRFNPVPEHIHGYMEMSYVFAGSCPQTVNGRQLTLEENQVLLLDSNCPHSIGRLDQNDIMLSLVVSKAYLRRLLEEALGQTSMLMQFLLTVLNEQTDHRRCVLFHSQDSRRLRRYFQDLMCEYLDPTPSAETIILHLLRLILVELVNVYESDCTQHADEGARSRVSVIPIIRYIEEHYLSCTQASVAEHFFISTAYVSVLLKRHTGMTYRQMVLAQKLGRAASLLRNTALPIADVAYESGYENLSFFYRKFREYYGCLPAEYRKTHASA